jgi:hypothetical protein
MPVSWPSAKGYSKQQVLIQSSESYQLAMYTLDQHRGTVVFCRYFPPPIIACPESLVTLKARFCDALARVGIAQPHLQVGITGESSKNPTFLRLDHLDLRSHLQLINLEASISSHQQYLKILQDYLDSKSRTYRLGLVSEWSS